MDRKIENKGWIPKKYRWLVISSGFMAAVITMIALQGNSSAYRVDKDSLTLATVKRAPFDDYINVRGRVEPTSLFYLDAVEGGIVESILKEEGEQVEKGDTLLILSNLNLSLNILNSEAQLAEKANFLRETQINMEQQKLSLERELIRLEYELKQSERKYQQDKGFYEEELIAKDQYLTSEEAYQMAVELNRLNRERLQRDAEFRKTQVKKIEQNLINMERNLALIYQRQDHLVVRAPVSGQLAVLNAVPGQAIPAGFRLGQVNELKEFKLQASVDEHYIHKVEKGLSATLSHQHKSYSLKISKIYPEVNQGQFLIDLVFTDKVPANIRSGQSYALNVSLGNSEDAILLSRGSFFQSTGGRWVYVLNESGDEAVKRHVRIGRQNPKHYEVLEGLEDGEIVVISAYDLFGDNTNLILE